MYVVIIYVLSILFFTKKMKVNLLKTVCCLFLPTLLLAQESGSKFSLSGTIRPRYELRDGYKSFLSDNVKAGQFVSQRTRLDAGFVEKDQYRVFLSVQDVSVWGDQPQLSDGRSNKLSVHQAWGEFNLSPIFSVKAGRQEIVYDDVRIFGNVDWTQQGRSHDAFLVKLHKGAWKADLGFAYNQETEVLEEAAYALSGYKSMQYLWAHHSADKLGASFLFLNNGLQVMDGTDLSIDYSQTLGTYLLYDVNESLRLHGSTYYQMGDDGAGRDLSAWYFALSAAYKINDTWGTSLGLEILSGNDYDNTDKNNAFSPFYGTNHKFNGHMDYFYVGAHANSVGLNDFYATVNYKKEKFSAFLTGHYFGAQGDMGKDAAGKDWDQYLGFELDLGLGYQVMPNVTFKGGFSQMFGSDGLLALKGASADTHKDRATWAYLMLVFTPKFL